MAMKTERGEATLSKNVRRLAVVTGATGGIGSAIAAKLADSETALFLQGRSRKTELETLRWRLEKMGASVETAVADLTATESQDAYFDRFTRWADSFSPETVDSILWINAAGIDLMTPKMKAASFEERLRMMTDLDVIAPVRLAKRFGVWLDSKGRIVKGDAGGGSANGLSVQTELSRPGDVILFFGWDGISRGMEGETAQLYALCKGGIAAFAKSLAQTLAPSVRVLTVSPGWIATTWGARASERMNRRVERESLSGRWGRSEEVADLVAFLVSPRASYLNGQNIEINGGFNYRFE